MTKRKLELIETEDGSHSLYVPHLNETYHSFHGAVQESRHVFIKQGLEYFHAKQAVGHTNVLEIGLGTGLNALLVAEWADRLSKNVSMTSYEAYPVDKKMAMNLNYVDFINNDHAEQWFTDIHQSVWGKEVEIHKYFQVNKIHQKIEEADLEPHFNVVFYDAFAPNKQAELWELPVLEKTFNALLPQGVFVTYCAKGQLKRDLKQLGFEVETLPGPPGKKEMVRAIKV